MNEPEKPRPRNWRTRLLARTIVLVAGLLTRTLRLTIEREAETEALVQNGGMLVTWHGRTLLPIARWRGRYDLRLWMLVSLSRDGDLQNEIFQASGYHVIRGSTGRRGVAATREALHALASGGVLAMTPDGPRGPTQVVQTGVVYFAQRSGKPIVPTGISAYPRWILGSWDGFLIPKPFARARWVYGDPLYVSSDESLESACLRLADAIQKVEAQAEAGVLPRHKSAEDTSGAAPASSNASAGMDKQP